MQIQKQMKKAFYATIFNNLNEAGGGYYEELNPNDKQEKKNEKPSNTKIVAVGDKFSNLPDEEKDTADFELDNLLNGQYETPTVDRNAPEITDSSSDFSIDINGDEIDVTNYNSEEKITGYSITDRVSQTGDNGNKSSEVHQTADYIGQYVDSDKSGSSHIQDSEYLGDSVYSDKGSSYKSQTDQYIASDVDGKKTHSSKIQTGDYISNNVDSDNSHSFKTQSDEYLGSGVYDNNGKSSYFDQTKYGTNIFASNNGGYSDLYVSSDGISLDSYNTKGNDNNQYSDAIHSHHEVTTRDSEGNIVESSQKEQTSGYMYNSISTKEGGTVVGQDKYSVYSNVYGKEGFTSSAQTENDIYMTADDNYGNFGVVGLNAGGKDEYYGKNYQTKTHIKHSTKGIEVRGNGADVVSNGHSLNKTSERSKHNEKVNKRQQHEINRNTSRSKHNEEVNMAQQHQIDKNTRDIQGVKSDIFINELTQGADGVAVGVKATTNGDAMLGLGAKVTHHFDGDNSISGRVGGTVDTHGDTYGSASVVYKHEF